MTKAVNKLLTFKNTQGTNRVALQWTSGDILKIGEKYNIKLHQRSKELSTDEASSFDLIKDIYFNLLNKKADIIIALQPTSPLREKDLLNNSLQHICSFGGWSL